jgi:hypothetical protein
MNWKKIILTGVVFGAIQIVYSAIAANSEMSDIAMTVLFFVMTLLLSIALTLWLLKDEKKELLKTAFIAGLAWSLIISVMEYAYLSYLNPTTILEYVFMWEIWVALAERIIVPPVVAIIKEHKPAKHVPPKIMR